MCLVVGLAASAQAQSPIAGILPNDSEVVVSVNIKQILESPLVKKHAADMVDQAIANSKEAKQLMEISGLDPRKDVSRVIMSLSGSDPSSMEAVVLVEGTYDPAKLNAAMAEFARAKNEVLSLVKDDDMTFYKYQGPESPQPTFIHVADKSLLVMASSKELVKDTLAKKTGGKKGGVSPEIKELLGRIKDDSSMFFVANIKGKTENLPIPNPEIAKVVEKIESLSLSVNLTQDVSIDLGVGNTDEDSATELGDLLAAGIPQAKSFVQLFALQQPKLSAPLKDIVSTLKAGKSGKIVSLKMSVPSKSVDALIDAAKAAQGGKGPND